jgi:hypothetical protein
MKKSLIILFAIMSYSIHAQELYMNVHLYDGTVESYLISEVDSITFSESAYDQLVAYYPFNGNAADYSGNENHGEIFGAIPSPDRFSNENQAYLFDGISSSILVLQDSTLEFDTNDFTVIAWIKSNSLEFARVISKGECFNHGWQLGVEDGFIKVSVQSPPEGPEYYISYQSLYTDGNWHMIALVRENGNLRLFGDGLPDSDYYLFPYTLSNTFEDMTIGRCIESGGSCDDAFFNGIIDDIRIYSRALSECEIMGLYHEGGW